MKNIIAVATLLVVAACSASTPTERTATAALSSRGDARADTLSIPLGQSAFVDGGRLEIRFDARVADSRCPANVNCVWAGDAHVRVTTRLAGGSASTADLHSGVEPRTISTDRYEISMVGMTPYPGAGDENATPVLMIRVSSK